MAKAGVVAMTPVAAVVRHVEWLEFALAAARDEETRRRERLAQATDKNREKRTVRLAEVTAEVRELGALVQGLKNLQARPAASSRATGTRRLRKASAPKPGGTSKAATSATPAAVAAATPRATAAAKPKTPRSTKPKTTGAKPATTRTTKRAPRRRGAGPASGS